MNYVAICKCGVVRAATVDHPDRKREVAKEVNSWIRSGFTVERKDDAYVREHFGKCRCKELAQTAPLFDEEAYS